MTAVLLPDELWDLIEPLLPAVPPRPKGGRPRVSDRACLTGILFVLRSGHSVANVASRTRLRLWHDLLAPSARLAAREHLGPHSLRVAGLARSRRLHRLVTREGRQLFRACRVR